MRYFAVLPFLAIAAGCPAPARSPNPPSEDLADKTVALVRDLPDLGVRAYCSGVWVAQNDILTANHCVESLALGEATLYATQGGVYEGAKVKEHVSAWSAVLIARDDSHDLALLRSLYAPKSHGVARVASVDPRRGEFVQSMGHPKGLWWSYSTGYVAAIRPLEILDRDLTWVQTTAPVSGGNSGGGLFNTQNELVGLCHASVNVGQNLNFFIHPTYIRAFLTEQAKADAKPDVKPASDQEN